MNEEHDSKHPIDDPANPTLPSTAQEVNPPPASQVQPEQHLATADNDTSEPVPSREPMSPFERASLRWNIAMFLVTLGTGFFIGLQWHEISKGSGDTHELAVQAKNQADRTKNIVDITQVQASATQAMAQATVAEVVAFVHMVPNLQAYPFRGRSQARVIVGFRNDGKTVAENVSVAATSRFRDSAPTASEYSDHFMLLPEGRFLPVGQSGFDNEFPNVMNGSRLYFWGKIKYDDWRGQPVLPPQTFCGYIFTKDVMAVQEGDPKVLPATTAQGYNECEPQ